jgi:hypothetical protein
MGDLWDRREDPLEEEVQRASVGVRSQPVVRPLSQKGHHDCPHPQEMMCLCCLIGLYILLPKVAA